MLCSDVQPGESLSPQEESNSRIEDIFVNKLCETILESLSISYHDREIVKSLFKNVLSPKIDNNYRKELGFLQQYANYILDKSAERLIERFDLKSKVNHDNALHAKFADIVNEIDKLIKEK